MLNTRAWVGSCSNSVPGLVPGTNLEDASSEEFLRAFTRVLWRDLIVDGAISVSVEADEPGDWTEVIIRDRKGVELINHQFNNLEERLPNTRELWEIVDLEFSIERTEPPIDWLIDQVYEWLEVDEEELVEVAAYCFPGIDWDVWDEASEQEQLDMASAALSRLAEAIDARDRIELAKWEREASYQLGKYGRISVSPWTDAMTWRGLDADSRDRILAWLRLMHDSDAGSGCDALLLLATLGLPTGESDSGQ